MRIIEAKAYFTRPVNTERVMSDIEEYGRTCYKSEDKMSEVSADAFIRSLIKRGHESVLEHEKLTARIILLARIYPVLQLQQG